MFEQAALIGLSGWRIAALISYERGPFDIFLRMRQKLGFIHNNGDPVSWPDKFISNIVACPWCLGLYATAAMWGLWQISQAAVIVIAASAILIAVERWNHNG